MTATWDSGNWGRNVQGRAVLRATQIGDKSVARFAHDDEDGYNWQRRPVRRPSSAPPSEREGSTLC